jgi:MFS family permease
MTILAMVTAGLPPKVRRNFFWDMAAAISCGFFLGAINPFILVQARRIGCSPTVVALLAAAPFIGMIFSSFWSSLIDVQKPVRSVVIWDGLARFVLLLLLLFPTRTGFVAIFIVYYLLTTVSPPAYATAMRVVYPNGIRGRLIGAVRVGSSLAGLVAAWAGGIVLPLWGPFLFFAASSVFGLMSSVFFSTVKELEPVEASPSRKDWGQAFHVFIEDLPYRRYILALFVYGFSNLMATPVYVLYYVDRLRVSDSFVSLMAFVTSLLSLVFYFVGGRLMDHKGPVRLSVVLIGINLLIPTIFFFTPVVWPLIIAAGVMGIMNAGLDLTALGNTMHYAGNRSVAPYFTIHITLWGTRGTIAPFIGPWLAGQFGFKWFFFIVWLINGIGLLMAIVAAKSGMKIYEESPIGLTSKG